MGMGLTIPNISNLPGVSRPGGAGFANNYSLNFVRANYSQLRFTPQTMGTTSISLWFLTDIANTGNSSKGILVGHNIQLPQSGISVSEINGNIRILYVSNSALKQWNTTIPFVVNQWYHIVITHSGDNSNIVQAAINGASLVSPTFNNTFTTPPIFAAVGNLWAANPNFGFGGNIDEFAIIPSTLSDSQVSSIYNSGKPNSLQSFNPSIWYRFQEGSGTSPQNSGSALVNSTINYPGTYDTNVP